jgi:hypothetical protein
MFGKPSYEYYELHQVERDELHEEWVWVRKESLREHTEGSRSALLFRYESEGKTKSVCCETLYADDTYLRNRHHPILVGKIVEYDPTNLGLTVEWGQPPQRASITRASDIQYDQGIDENSLRNDLAVCVHYSKVAGEYFDGTNENSERPHKATCPLSLEAKRITGGNELVFMNAWYRCQLGIEEGRVKKRIPLSIKAPPYSPCQAMWWQLRACARHPQIAVVMSTVLAIVGTGLGIVGFAALLNDLLKSISGFQWVWQSIAILGFLIFLVGFRPLYLRAKQSLPDAK